MCIAYLVNQYPKTSHSFIRREIHALENLESGMKIARYSVRKTTEILPDSQDQTECSRTEVILDAGFIQLVAAAFFACIAHPVRTIASFIFATRLGFHGDRGLIRHWIYWLEAIWLEKSLRAKGVTHVHSHFGTNSTTVAMLCHELGGPPFSFTVHGPEEFDRPDAIHLAEKIRRCRFVVAISSFGRSQLMRWCETSQWAKIHVVHCTVEPSYLTATTTPVPDNQTLVCVGRLCEQKGQLLLIQAMKLVVSDFPNARLRLVGDGPMRKECERLIEKLQLQNHVTITGWASGEQVRQELIAARGIVLPSFAEGLPVVIMEALALGRPVISTYIAGIPELITSSQIADNVSPTQPPGWLVPAGDIEALQEAIASLLLASMELLQKMSLTGIRLVSERHNPSTEAAKLRDLFLGTK
jgi:glycosyltransferase involved in cell wall biosynthesis